jgi:hypothetical protein
MTAKVQHPVWGEIVFEESFWTGKRRITMKGIELKEEKKKVLFSYFDGERSEQVQVKGSSLSGVQLLIGGECIQLTPRTKWYEFACSVILAVSVLTWGNSPALCALFPIVGGALGGGIAGAMMIVNLYLMKQAGRVWTKLLIWLGLWAATFLICFALAIPIILLAM